METIERILQKDRLSLHSVGEDERLKLKRLGFYEHFNVWTSENVWGWGWYTDFTPSGERVDIPIIEWNEETKMAFASPINFKKIITSVTGLEKLIDATNFLMSTES